MKSIRKSRVLLSHHWSFFNQRQPIFSHDLIYLTSSNDNHPQVVNLPVGSCFDVEELLKQVSPNWYPELFIAKVDSFFNLVPLNVEALKCPKVLILGDTQHGLDPLNRMIEYAKSEKYDLYITDHKRHHLWYYWLAGLKNLFWLPGLFLNPPAPGFEHQPFDDYQINKHIFQGKAVFIGQVGKYHPRRKKLIEYAANYVPNFISGQLSQQDSLKAFAAADISLNISLNGDINLRNFEVIASKGFLLTDQLTDESGMDLILEAGTDYESFSNPDDMVNKLLFFLKNKSIRNRYRERSYTRYCYDYTPQRMEQRLNQLLQGVSIEKRFTIQSIKRIQYCKDIEFSRARISLYQVIQDIHRDWEFISILLDARIKFTSAADFLDLPRVKITMTNYEDIYAESLCYYLEQSGNTHRISFAKDIQDIHGFNVIVTSICEPRLLSQIPNADMIIISNDYDGLERVLQYSEFQRILSSQVNNFAGDFFVISRKHLQSCEFQSNSPNVGWKYLDIGQNRQLNDLINEFNLRDINIIIFPDWSQSEELLFQDVSRVLQELATLPHKSQIALLIDTSNISEQDANLFLSGVTMNLLMQEDLDVTEGLELSLVGNLDKMEWELLLPRIQGRIALENENQQAILQLGAQMVPLLGIR
ncbi:MAG: glycosyltransferase [Coleofasciculus sp. B1-GNL1-01]|uniref:glycosyltransferase family protein n=1 Tax=Coleofasciculus sp. B1-GNL1-01 TaxID=3068484 RepID=UPI0033011B67